MIFSMLAAGACHFPIAHDDAGAHLFCGDLIWPGKPYCSAHCAIAYVGFGERKGVTDRSETARTARRSEAEGEDGDARTRSKRPTDGSIGSVGERGEGRRTPQAKA